MNVHQKKLTNESKAGTEFDAAFGTILKISKRFQRTSQNFILIFL
jgi:hypothetical protein